MSQPLVSIVFGHANGFPAPVYRKFREGLGASRWFEADCLGQGTQGIGRNWTGITQQMLACARQAPRPRIGLGHSLGGFALYLAEHQEPGLLDGLVLMEPPMFRPATRNLIRLIRTLGLLNRFPPVSLALRRRRHWPDRDTARPFALGDLSPGGDDDVANDVDLLDEVEMDLRVELGRTQMRLEEVLRLRKGSVVALDKLAGDPVDIFANGRLVARGEVLVMNDNFCVRVTELVGG